MKTLNINFSYDEDRTIKLNDEINHYLKIAQERGICTHIEGFFFFNKEVEKKYFEDCSAVYYLKKTDQAEYYDSIKVTFDRGLLVSINFETWRNDWDGQEKQNYSSERGARMLSVCRGYSVDANTESFYECQNGILAILE